MTRLVHFLWTHDVSGWRHERLKAGVVLCRYIMFGSAVHIRDRVLQVGRACLLARRSSLQCDSEMIDHFRALCRCASCRQESSKRPIGRTIQHSGPLMIHVMLLVQKAKLLRQSVKDDTVRPGHTGTSSVPAHVLETAPCFVLLDFR